MVITGSRKHGSEDSRILLYFTIVVNTVNYLADCIHGMQLKRFVLNLAMIGIYLQMKNGTKLAKAYGGRAGDSNDHGASAFRQLIKGGDSKFEALFRWKPRTKWPV